MLLDTIQDPIQSSGLGEGNTFTIAASAKAFEVLSSNLYQNKVLAVIREISCNAADAHTVVGAPLSTIEVHLPTYASPFFSVRDFGPGLSHADVLSLYTSYFRSTKDQDNTLIGGFGLGSKSPFAVADQFTVTSWHDNIKSTYICYKDSGVPRVNTIGRIPSAEPTGLEVKVATKNVSEWTTNAASFYKWWPVLPTFTSPAPSITALGNLSDAVLSSKTVASDGFPHWAVLRSGSGEACVIMGLVPYRLDLRNVSNLNLPFGSLNLCLRFEVGELAISPSRETLSYDPATQAALKARLTTIANEIKAEASAFLASCTTLYEARCKFFKDFSDSFIPNFLSNSGHIKWNGKNITAYVDFNFGDHPSLIGTMQHFRYGRFSYHKHARRQSTNIDGFSHRANSSEERPIVWLSAYHQGTYALLEHHFAKPGGWAVDVITGSTFADVSAALEEAGLPPPIDGSALPKPPPPPKLPRKVSSTTKAYRLHTDNTWTREVADVDLAGGGLYLSFFDRTVEDHDLFRILTAIRNLGWLTSATRILGFPKSALSTKAMQARLSTHGWQPFTHAWIADNVPLSDIAKQANLEAGASAFSQLDNHNKASISQAFGSLAKMPSNTLSLTKPDDLALWNIVSPFFNKAGERIAPAAYILNNPGVASALTPAQSKEIKDAQDRYANLGAALAAFQTRHPLLKHLDRYTAIPHTVLLPYLNR